MTDKNLCFWHCPDHAEEVAEARRLGGLRRRREVAVVGAYELGGLDTVVDLRRILEIALLDTLSLDNSIARARTLGYLVGVAAKLLEVGELEQRLAYLEAAVHIDLHFGQVQAADGSRSPYLYLQPEDLLIVFAIIDIGSIFLGSGAGSIGIGPLRDEVNAVIFVFSQPDRPIVTEASAWGGVFVSIDHQSHSGDT